MSKKLISLRLDSEILDEVDRVADYSEYWKRSHVISKLLDCVLSSADSETILRMVRFSHFATRSYVLHLSEDEPNE